MKTRNVNPTVALSALMSLDAQSASTGLSPAHRDLIKLRASQINGCAYCVDMHAKEAKDHGESDRRLHNLSVWREAPFYSPEDRAILALTEEVTRIGDRVSDETFKTVSDLLGETYLVAALLAIITINSWNRLAISLEMKPAAQ